MDFMRFLSKGILSRVSIKHKILGLSVIGITVFVAYLLCAIVLGNNQIRSLEDMYKKNVVPLDKLRKIQLLFREMEFRMGGAMADMVTPTAAVNHLKESLKEVDAIWSEIGPSLNDENLIEYKENFEKGHAGFKGMAHSIENAYMKIFYDSDIDEMEDMYDEWLDVKALIFKSIDHIAEYEEQSLEKFYVARVAFIKKLITKNLIHIMNNFFKYFFLNV